MPPRRAGEITQLERDVLSVAHELDEHSQGSAGWFWAYGLATILAERYDRKSLLDHGTIYKVLKGMSSPSRGLLESRLEDAEEAKGHRGPPRRYYRISDEGRVALARAESRPSVIGHIGLLGAGPEADVGDVT